MQGAQKPKSEAYYSNTSNDEVCGATQQMSVFQQPVHSFCKVAEIGSRGLKKSPRAAESIAGGEKNSGTVGSKKALAFSRVLKNSCSGRLFKNARMQGAQKSFERGVYEKYVER